MTQFPCGTPLMLVPIVLSGLLHPCPALDLFHPSIFWCEIVEKGHGKVMKLVEGLPYLIEPGQFLFVPFSIRVMLMAKPEGIHFCTKDLLVAKLGLELGELPLMMAKQTRRIVEP